MDPFLFGWLAIAFLLTHEMDATWRHEWRLLPILNRMNDTRGFQWFLIAHVPLYVLLFAGLVHQHSATVTALSLFSIIHLGLHYALRKHPKYEFNNPLSWFLIAGAAVAGALDLVWRQLLA